MTTDEICRRPKPPSRPAALEEGRSLIEAELERDPKAPVGIYRNFATMLVRRHALRPGRDLDRSGGRALSPGDAELWNTTGRGAAPPEAPPMKRSSPERAAESSIRRTARS